MTKEKIIDYVSGIEIVAKPEEIDAVQVFSKRLVEEFNYDKKLLQTRPQFTVRRRPSDEKKEYPVDIAIFKSKNHLDSELIGLVECKKKTRKDGLEQLKIYMDMCTDVQFGVWFNGEDQINIQKIKVNGSIQYREIPNIPKCGQRIEDIGKYKRKDLKPATDLKSSFRIINNYLYGNMKKDDTSTRNRAKQIINILFCKIYDEKYTALNDEVTFRAGYDEEPSVVAKRIKDLFVNVKTRFSDVFDETDSISLDDASIVFTIGQLQEICITESPRDVIGDAFEVFVSKALKGDEGQFFTPRNIIKMVVDIVNPSEDSMIIDPACGTGGFLIESLRHVWGKLDSKAKEMGWSKTRVEEEKQYVATCFFRGIDKDSFVTKVTKAYMAILGDGRGGIFCENSLDDTQNWSSKCKEKIELKHFDIVFTNPPFGSKIPIKDENILKQYELGHKWTYDKKAKQWIKTDELANKGKKGGVEPQILFIERCAQLLKVGGKIGIVLPDGIYGNDKLGYIRDYILRNFSILAIIDVPSETFQPNTSTKTTIMIAIKKNPEDIVDVNHKIFMAVCDTCGHDRRGNLIEEDDVSQISELYNKFKEEQAING